MSNITDLEAREAFLDKLCQKIQRREGMKTEEAFNAATMDIYGDLARLRFPDPKKPAWVRLIGQLLTEIATGRFIDPHKFADIDGEQVLMVRTSHVMDHLARTAWLREFWPDIDIKSDRQLKKSLRDAGVLILDEAGQPKVYELAWQSERVGHLALLRLSQLRNAGLKVDVSLIDRFS